MEAARRSARDTAQATQPRRKQQSMGRVVQSDKRTTASVLTSTMFLCSPGLRQSVTPSFLARANCDNGKHKTHARFSAREAPRTSRRKNFAGASDERTRCSRASKQTPGAPNHEQRAATATQGREVTSPIFEPPCVNQSMRRHGFIQSTANGPWPG